MTHTVVAWSPSSFGQADDAPLRMLEEAGVEVRPNPFGRRLTEDEAIEHLDGVHGLIAGLEPLTRRVLEASPTLRSIARVGIGVDNIDHEAAAELGISVSNTPDPPAESVGELTMAAALVLARGIVPANEALHRGDWDKRISGGIMGQEVLHIGFGRIGRATARRMHALGAQILACDPIGPTNAPDFPVEWVDLGEGLSRAAIVSLHAAGRDVILGNDEFRQMRRGAMLLNSARAELVDEGALIHALDSGILAGAWFDVFWEEPYSGRLTEYEQVLMTPHIGTYTATCRRDMETSATRNLFEALGIEVPG